ncbi:hypothetical protein SAY87_005697 [Trapa incisa]|uniref:RING-type domain-containing protein n=1 Tax=Trapa incisa TaxID=236973 RepID=A0AAN7Q7Z4_9MYRT|nr:hypothetical protein SAY87_005697 [Trapa incisa]
MGVSSGIGGGSPRESVPLEVTAKILMTAAVVLFLLVIFVLVLHLYAKWFWGRVEEPLAAGQQSPGRGRRRQHRQRRPFAFSAATHDNPARKGLDPAILRSLTEVVLGPEELGDGLECAICLSELAQGEKARLLPKCNHGFHSDCIDLWFESHCTCPICRNPVGAADSSKSAEADVGITGSNSSAGDTFDENLSNGQPSESPNFPTNVLFWGDENQIISRTAASLEEAPSSSSSSSSSSLSAPLNNGVSSAAAGGEGVLAIDIRRLIESSSSRFVEEDPKSPVTTSTRLRSLKRFLSRDKRVSSCSSSSGDPEQI